MTLGDDWLDTPPAGERERRHFFVSAAPGDQWHVESDDNCEVMLCGKHIPSDGPGSNQVRIQSWWGPKKCPDCFLKFGAQEGYLP